MLTDLSTWLPLARRDEIAGRRHKAIEPLEVVVWHYTAGPGSPRRWLRDRADGVCWHFTVEREGIVYQHAPLDARLGHAGGSRLGGRGNVNGRSIGVEVANLGPVEILQSTTGRGLPLDDLEPRPGGFRVEAQRLRERGVRCGRIVNGNPWIMPATSDVFVDEKGLLWEAMSRGQLEAIVTLARELATWSQVYADGVLTTPTAHVGHGAIRTTKRPRGIPEPAPCFPWESVRATVAAVGVTASA